MPAAFPIATIFVSDGEGLEILARREGERVGRLAAFCFMPTAGAAWVAVTDAASGGAASSGAFFQITSPGFSLAISTVLYGDTSAGSGRGVPSPRDSGRPYANPADIHSSIGIIQFILDTAARSGIVFAHVLRALRGRET